MNNQSESIESIARNLEVARQYLLSEMGKQDTNTEAMEHLLFLTQDCVVLLGITADLEDELEDAKRDIRMLEEDKDALEYDIQSMKSEIREFGRRV